jgi:alkanesulfonate monooxygenase SsuD/methylene tetrahydromethanopterin reductase-like flavin-dependent oxidoreductase (luciferase family)
MKFGIFSTVTKADERSAQQLFHENLEQVVYAEELGYDSFWFAEHHFSNYSMIASPNLMVAAASQRTERIKLGPAVNVLPFHHPIRLAEEGAMLDMMSNGRLQWGVGRGIQPAEFLPWKVDHEQSREIFDETHEAVVRAWTQKTFSFEGKHIHIPETSLEIRPVQSPHPPIWTAGLSEPSVRWAARHNYPCMEVYTLLPLMQQHWEIYKQENAAHGHQINHAGLVPTRHVYLAESDAQAKAEVLPTLATRWEQLLKLAKPADMAQSKSYAYLEGTFEAAARGDLDELMDLGMLLIGTPETAIRLIKRHQDFLEDLEYMILFFAYGNLTQEQVCNSMRLFAEEVMPEFT